LKLAVDLHIHTALSPCADDDMTPCNIANMAALKGLDAIAATDHNCCFNARAVAQCARDAGVVFIPGIEVTTSEETHMLVYFEEIEAAEVFGNMIYESLPDIPLKDGLFGSQLIINEKDTVTGKAEKLLAQAAPYTVKLLQQEAKRCGGLMIPAHINRQAYSILETLGFIPEDLELTTVEIRRNMPLPEVYRRWYNTISSSDAHMLFQILEREEFIEAEERTAKGILNALSEKWER